MTLKHTFSNKPNPKYNEQQIKLKTITAQKLKDASSHINRADAVNNAMLLDAQEVLTNNLRATRIDLKKLLAQPKILQEIHITSDKKWKMYHEYIGEVCGRTRYKPVEEFSVDIKLPYSKMAKKILPNGQVEYDEDDQPVMVEVNTKEAIRSAEKEALADLRDYRQKSREVPFIEKTYDIPGLPIKPKYKVYAGNGNGGPKTEYVYKDLWRGTSLSVVKPEQTDNYFIHMEGGTFLKLQEASKTRKVFEPKKPLTDTNHVGVEIEFISKMDKFAVATALCAQNVQDFVCLKDDGSLRPEDDYEHCHELTVCAPEQLIVEVLRRILLALNKDDMSKVNNKCGLHVHLDMRNRDKHLAFYNLSKAQHILYAMNPRSRTDGTKSDGRKDTLYSKKISTADFEEARREVGSERYCGINLQALAKYNTIEIRIHSGSTNFEKISNWVTILMNIVNMKERVEAAANKAETFCTYYGLKPEMVEYINKRIALFRDKSGQHITLDEAC